MQCACQISPSHPHLLMFHPPSLLCPHGHFDTSFLSASSSLNCSRSESAGQAHFRMSAEESGNVADPTLSTGCEPKEFDKITSADGGTTLVNDPNYDNISDISTPHARTPVCSVFPQCLNPLFCTFVIGDFVLQTESKESKPSSNRCCDQCCRVEVKEKSTEQC